MLKLGTWGQLLLTYAASHGAVNTVMHPIRNGTTRSRIEISSTLTRPLPTRVYYIYTHRYRTSWERFPKHYHLKKVSILGETTISEREEARTLAAKCRQSDMY